MKRVIIWKLTSESKNCEFVATGLPGSIPFLETYILAILL